MQLGPGAQPLLGLSLLLLLLSILLGDPAISVPAVTILLFLGASACHQAVSFGRVVSSLSVERRTKPSITRQGGSVGVETSIGVREMHGLRLWIVDLPPRSAIVLDGSNAAEIGTSGDGAHIRYRMRPMARGVIRFGGMEIGCRSALFTMRLVMKGEKTTASGVTVRPGPALVPRGSASPPGERERDLALLPGGTGIRSFRYYLPGDELRDVDWKLTARHRRMVIRVYSGALGPDPLIFLDLPHETGPGGAKGVERLIAAVQEHVNRLHSEGRECEICIVSGANVAGLIHASRRGKGWVRDLSSVCPGEGHLPLIRYSERPAILANARRLARQTANLPGLRDEERHFCRSLADFWERAAAAGTETPLQNMLRKLTGYGSRGEVFIYTPLLGDTSHLGLLVSEAQRQRQRVHLRIPREALARTGRERGLLRTARSVEGIG